MTKPTEHTLQDTGHDDLTRIKGIGEVTQQWLRDTFSVRSYHDLVMVSPADIEEQLKAEGKITARSKIDEWLAQARTLAGSVDTQAKPKSPANDAQETWKTFSTFVIMFEEQQVQGEIRFQTKAHHMEVDNTQSWQGISHSELIRWILLQLGPRGAKALEAVAPKPHAAPQVSEPEPMDYSEKLRRYAAKAQTLAGTQGLPLPSEARQQAPGRPDLSEKGSPTPSPYSDKLQQFIMKAHRLTGNS